MTPPAWLADFQARFGAMLRTPLDRGTGTLRATPSRYGAELRREARHGPRAPADERLAVYNRQYWFRLFGLVQSAFPLTARLLGYWHFNGYATRFLLARPPSGWNVERAAEGFDAFLVDLLDAPSVRLEPGGSVIERDALLEAAKIDAAWRSVFFAPNVPAFRPSPADAHRLLDGRLAPSPTVIVFGEHWPLLELRRRIGGVPGESPIALPPKLEKPAFWALVRKPAGIGELPLERREAELFLLLREHPIREALSRLEGACSGEERAALP